MKYINSRDLMMFLGQPITRLSVFEAETVDTALSMCADAFKKMENDFQVSIDFPTFKYQLLKTMSEFLVLCQEEHHEGLENPRKRIDEKQYKRKHIDLASWPKSLQKNNAENLFLIEYCLTYADILFRYLLDSGLKKDIAGQLASDAADKLAEWVSENCIKRCDYECVRRSHSNGYCTLCSFMLQPLACPMKNEISYRQLQLREEDIQCKRKE